MIGGRGIDLIYEHFSMITMPDLFFWLCALTLSLLGVVSRADNSSSANVADGIRFDGDGDTSPSKLNSRLSSGVSVFHPSPPSVTHMSVTRFSLAWAERFVCQTL